MRAIALFEAVDGRDVRMVQGRQELRFALEPRKVRRIGRQAVAEDLIATLRLSLVSRPRYTSPMAPAPSAERIS